MKRLFILRAKKKGPVVTDHKGNPMYFESKIEAKEVRNTLRTTSRPDCVVSFGPDHRLFTGE